MKELFYKFTKFSLKTFYSASPESLLQKCKGEIAEIESALSAIHATDADIAEEYVDAVMCLFDSMARYGISYELFEHQFRHKLEKNINRTWVKNADNTYSHVK